jgi:uncharacterized protein
MEEQWNRLPEFPRFKDISLEEKDLFEGIFAQYPPSISEFTFTNLFIWRYAYHTKVCRLEDFICLLSEQGKESYFFAPIGKGDLLKCSSLLLHYLKEIGAQPRMVRVPEEMISQVDWKSGGLVAEFDRDQSDYIYLAQDLIQLQGRKYHRKRNHIKQFKEKNTYQYIPLSQEWIGSCLDLQTAWCDLRQCEADPNLMKESTAINEALTQFDQLSAKGGAILINGKVEAFTLGEPLNQDTVVIHIEKANPGIDGLYPAINQAFLEQEWSSYTYVNREQDLGEEGLRKAKESYFPHHLINKYTITLS